MDSLKEFNKDSQSFSELSTASTNFNSRIKEFFELNDEDELLKEFDCYLLKNFLLKGTLFVLQSHLCFHASLNSNEKISYQGWMHKKSRRTKKYKQYHFILRNNELAWFDTPNNLYFPINSILLSEIVLITSSKSKPKVFRVGTCSRNFSFYCNTTESMKEWMQVLQRAAFTSIHDGNDIKVVIPFSNILKIQHTSTIETMPECLICHVKDVDLEDEYYFCNFYDYTLLKNIIDIALSNYTIDRPNSPLKDNLPSLEISTKSLRQLHATSLSAGTINPKFKNHRKSLSAVEHSPPTQQLSQLSLLSHSPSLFLKWFKSEDSVANSNELKIFPIPPTEETIVKAISYFIKKIPIRGTVYLTNRFLCFKSMAGFKLKAVIPIRDILTIEEVTHKLAVHVGLLVTTVDGRRLLFEFYDSNKRNLIKSMISEQLHGLVKSGTPSISTMNTALQDVLQDIHTNDTHFKITRNSSFNPINSDALIFHKPLKIVFLTIGSRGDVQPFIALAIRFQKDGHECTIATHLEYKEWILSYDIKFKHIKGDPAQIMKLCINYSMFSIQFIREVFSTFREWLDELLVSSYEACIGADCLIESGGSLGGLHIVEKLQIPYFRAFMMPFSRNTSYPHPFAVPSIRMGGRYNYSTYVLFDQMMWQIGYYVFDHFRDKVLGLTNKSFSNLNAPFLYGFSPTIVPAAPEWQDVAYVCGYWFLDASVAYQCPMDLLTFFDTKTPVIYIGFGSIIVDDPDELTDIIYKAVVKADVKAIVCKGWSGRKDNTTEHVKEHKDYDYSQYTSHLYMTENIPHDWLFSRTAAVCHHGGSGTTAAGLRAGKPTIIKPFFGDQYFWGQRIEELGIGVTIKKLTVDKLSEAFINVTTNESMMKKAEIMGQQIRAEDGVETALKVFYSRYGQATAFVKDMV